MVDFFAVGGFVAVCFLVGVFGIRRNLSAFAAEALLGGVAVTIKVVEGAEKVVWCW